MLLTDCVNRLARELHKVERAEAAWDPAALRQGRERVAKALAEIRTAATPGLSEVEAAAQRVAEELAAPGYAVALERALRDAGLPVEGVYPEYDLPPFRLNVEVDNEVVQLVLGRRRERLRAFAPTTVAVWVAKRYQAVTRRPFHPGRFVDDLVAAFELASRLAYADAKRQVLWGRTVALRQLYELMTLRREYRREYPLGHFTYDLARLRQAGLHHPPYRLEFGFSRDAAKALLLRDSGGREERFSTLAVHREER
jgi:hypothetical protein